MRYDENWEVKHVIIIKQKPIQFDYNKIKNHSIQIHTFVGAVDRRMED